MVTKTREHGARWRCCSRQRRVARLAGAGFLIPGAEGDADAGAGANRHGVRDESADAWPIAEVNPAPASEDKAEARPEGRMEPSGADADRWVFRFVTPSTKMNIDPTRGKASLETPLGSLSLDTEKREARMNAAPLYLGLGW